MTRDEVAETDRNRRHHNRQANWSNGTGAAGHQNQFDQNHIRYRTCCSCHVRGCSLVIGIMEMIALIAAVVGTAVAYFALPGPGTTADGAVSAGLLSHAELSLVGAVAALLIGSIVVASLMYGLVQERPTFLLPHLIAQLMAIIGLAAAVVVFVYVSLIESEYGPMITIPGSRDRHDRPDSTEVVYGCIVISLCGLACAFEVYFVIVVYRAYVYFQAKRQAREKMQLIQLRATTMSFPGHDSIAAQRYWVQD